MADGGLVWVYCIVYRIGYSGTRVCLFLLTFVRSLSF
jgi:hypothetical protein